MRDDNELEPITRYRPGISIKELMPDAHEWMWRDVPIISEPQIDGTDLSYAPDPIPIYEQDILDPEADDLTGLIGEEAAVLYAETVHAMISEPFRVDSYAVQVMEEIVIRGNPDELESWPTREGAFSDLYEHFTAEMIRRYPDEYGTMTSEELSSRLWAATGWSLTPELQYQAHVLVDRIISGEFSLISNLVEIAQNSPRPLDGGTSSGEAALDHVREHGRLSDHFYLPMAFDLEQDPRGAQLEEIYISVRQLEYGNLEPPVAFHEEYVRAFVRTLFEAYRQNPENQETRDCLLSVLDSEYFCNPDLDRSDEEIADYFDTEYGARLDATIERLREGRPLPNNLYRYGNEE